MANEVVKKVIIPRKDINSIAANGTYYLRYRVISEDKTRTSHWSPLYSVDGGILQDVSNVISLTQTSAGIDVSWGILNTLKINNYDVYLREDDTSTSAWNGGGSTTATELTGFVATLSTATNAVTLTTGTTANMKVGQAVTKTSGTGNFGATPVYIKAITGTTTFTVSNENGSAVNHGTNGSTTFKVAGQSLNYYTSTSGKSLLLPLPAVNTKVSVAILAQSYPQYAGISSFKTAKPAVFLVESSQLTVV